MDQDVQSSNLPACGLSRVTVGARKRVEGTSPVKRLAKHLQ